MYFFQKLMTEKKLRLAGIEPRIPRRTATLSPRSSQWHARACYWHARVILVDTRQNCARVCFRQAVLHACLCQYESIFIAPINFDYSMIHPYLTFDIIVWSNTYIQYIHSIMAWHYKCIFIKPFLIQHKHTNYVFVLKSLRHFVIETEKYQIHNYEFS